MKRLNTYLTILSIIFGLTIVSCGGDKTDEPALPSKTLILRTQSIDDGATVNETVTALTLTFNNTIQLVSGHDITVNGNKAAATTKGMDLTIPLTLQRWNTYDIVIPAGAICITDDQKVVNTEIRISFDTKYGYEPGTEPTVARSLINPKATAEAKATYQYLLDNYGKKMLSGAMGGIGWETTYTDFIEQQTGHYPEVVGFDYLHLAYSPANWINYGDITPVKTCHDRGCIIEIQWHWNVPRSQGSTDLSFYLEGNSFNPENVYTAGTWENQVAEADIEKLAGYLQLLQDANIAVLWRPLHEAAGDYKWGAWFWWGAKGPEVTKRLYRYLYDKLTNTYGLNNLIWVWTVCTSYEGKPASLSTMQAAYPGDEYVDIVGADIYPETPLTDQSSQYQLVQQTVDGRKMVALTECGNLIDPKQAYDNGALWSYFMQWYDYKDGKFGFYNYSGPEQWNEVLASPYVTSR